MNSHESPKFKPILEKLASARRILKAVPNDPAAKLTMARHQFSQGDMEKSLPVFLASKDPFLSPLAKSDLANPTESAAQIQLADDWLAASERRRAAELKSQMRKRAAYWYDKALPASTGVNRMKAESQLKDLLLDKGNADESPVIACYNELRRIKHDEDMKKTASESTAVTTIYHPAGSGYERFNLVFRWEYANGNLSVWQESSIPNNRSWYFYCPAATRIQISFIPAQNAAAVEQWLDANFTHLPKERIGVADGKPYHLHVTAEKKIEILPGK